MKRLQAPEGVHAVTFEQTEYPAVGGVLALPDDVAAVFIGAPFNMKLAPAPSEPAAASEPKRAAKKREA